MKKSDYLNWEEYFMSIAILSAKRSKDPSTQVGACIVNANNRIVSVGYNGFPRGCSDDVFPWTKGDDVNDSKYLYVTHAELNAILNCRWTNLEDTIIYVTHFPCNECSKAIIQSGIKEVIYMYDKNNGRKDIVASKRMFDAAGIKYREYKKNNKDIEINL